MTAPNQDHATNSTRGIRLGTEPNGPPANPECAHRQVPPQPRLEELAAQQGVQPLTEADLDAMGGIWPEDEDVDEAVETIRRWRHEGTADREE